MKEMVMMEREEYKAYQNSFVRLNADLQRATDEAHAWRMRANTLWDALNRPAIQALQDKHNQEYYSWCDEIAQKYEKLDEEEWITSRGRFYNNGRDEFCACHKCAEEDVELLWKYGDNPRVCWEKTEGWSDVPINPNCRFDKYTWILSNAQDDVWERYKKTGNKRLYHLWLTFIHMKEESRAIDPNFGGFYR